MRLNAGSIQDALAGGDPKGVIFVSLGFDSGSVYLTDAADTIDYLGINYVGLGKLLSIELPDETNDTEILGGSLQVSGVPSSDLSLALTENVQGRPITITFGVMNSSFGILATPSEFVGRLDRFKWTRTKTTAVLELTFESEMAIARRPKIQRFTLEDRQRLYPNDNHLKYLNRMKEIVVIFPTAEAQKR